MSQILTLIALAGGLGQPHLLRTRAALQALGADAGTPDWLSAEEAADIPFDGLAAEQAIAVATQALDGAAIDVIATPAEGRRKRLLLADMDSTIVTVETLDEIAAFAGLKERIAEITRRSMNGELDFRTALIERVGMLAGLDVAALERTWAATSPHAGRARTGRHHAGARRLRALVSGGFTFFTGRVAALSASTRTAPIRCWRSARQLTGKVARADPRPRRQAGDAEAPGGRACVAAVGRADGGRRRQRPRHDPAAGLGVAFRAKPIVAAAARARLDHADLRGLLFAQGYRAEEIVAG